MGRDQRQETGRRKKKKMKKGKKKNPEMLGKRERVGGGRLEMEEARGEEAGKRGEQAGWGRNHPGERKCCALWIIVCLSSGMV